MSRIASFLFGLVKDPVSGDLSSARVGGLVCLIIGSIVALTHPEYDGTVAAMIGGGAVSLLSRTRAEGE